jgi:hypothetical protein
MLLKLLHNKMYITKKYTLTGEVYTDIMMVNKGGIYHVDYIRRY